MFQACVPLAGSASRINAHIGYILVQGVFELLSGSNHVIKGNINVMYFFIINSFVVMGILGVTSIMSY